MCSLEGWIDRYHQERLMDNVFNSLLLISGPFFFVWAVVNSVAWAYGTTQALPVGTIILLMCLWMFGM